MPAESDFELIAYCLSMRANFIETGSPILSANDVQTQMNVVRRSADDLKRSGISIKPLSTEQHELVARLRQMAAAQLQAHSQSRMEESMEASAQRRLADFQRVRGG